MSGNSKRKLALVAGIFECLVYAEAKYCAFEKHGDPQYYVCPRTEYCCNFGCCVSPGFQIYHLWYYWLLVIIMFLVCSGGGWWYRYWLQGRYRAAASAIPSRGPGSSRGQSALRGPACPAQQASITYNSARNTVLLHRMWKAAGPHRGAGSSPAYSGAPLAAAGGSTHFQNTSVVLNDVNCPYYQLYGPPPSYETVIAQTRGKISSPMSPERTRSLEVSSAAPGSSVLLPNQDLISRCYNHSPYNSHPSQPGSLAGIQDSATLTRYESTPNGVVEALEAQGAFSSPYAPPYTSSSSGATPLHSAVRQDSCLPLDYHGGPLSPIDYHTDPASIVPDTFRIYPTNNLQRLPSYHGERSALEAKTRRPNGSPLQPGCTVRELHRSSLVLPGDSHSSVPDLKVDGAREATEQQRQRYARQHGGSLKFSRSRDDALSAAIAYNRGRAPNLLGVGIPPAAIARSSSSEDNRAATASGEQQIQQIDATNQQSRFRDTDLRDPDSQIFASRSRIASLAPDSARASLRRYGVAPQQPDTSNPSDNVILEPLTAAAGETRAAEGTAETPSRWRTRRRDIDDEEVPRGAAGGAQSIGPARGGEKVLNNHESKHNKLDRSKSLD